MSEPSEVRVPDIGDFDDVPVIEILVSVGDTVAVEDPLVTLESDKATMDVPAPFAGVVNELSVSVGDRVSEGSLLLTLDGAAPGCGRPRGVEDGARRRRRPRWCASRSLHPLPRLRRLTATATSRWWCSGPGPAATRPRSGRPTWGCAPR